MAYCVASDLYLYGLPRGALASPGRLVGAASATTDTLELDGHGFDDDTALQFRTAGGGTLPSPIVEGTTYYAIVVDEWHFQIAASAGGAAIDLTTEGTTFTVYAPLPIASALEEGARMIDDMLPAHVVPLTSPYPDVIVMTNAQLAAAKLLALTGNASASLAATYDDARKRVERWARGVPVRGTNAPTGAQHATYAATSTSSWKTYGGIG